MGTGGAASVGQLKPTLAENALCFVAEEAVRIGGRAVLASGIGIQIVPGEALQAGGGVASEAGRAVALQALSALHIVALLAKVAD